MYAYYYRYPSSMSGMDILILDLGLSGQRQLYLGLLFWEVYRNSGLNGTTIFICHSLGGIVYSLSAPTWHQKLKTKDFLPRDFKTACLLKPP